MSPDLVVSQLTLEVDERFSYYGALTVCSLQRWRLAACQSSAPRWYECTIKRTMDVEGGTNPTTPSHPSICFCFAAAPSGLCNIGANGTDGYGHNCTDGTYCCFCVE
jgi:hypothetical protein